MPKTRLRALEQSLEEGKEAECNELNEQHSCSLADRFMSTMLLQLEMQADWRILKNIPAFCSCAYQPFLARLHKAMTMPFMPANFSSFRP